MTVRSGLCGLCLVFMAVNASAAQRPGESDQQTLISLERDWNEAFYNKDTSVIEALLADDFTATYDDGSRGDKARELMLTREFDQQVESAVQDGFTVKIYGNTAVVWFTLHLAGIKQGKPSELALSYTDVWVMRDRWQCISTQGTRVTAK
jgi:ketosteroid isomerase-like protein